MLVQEELVLEEVLRVLLHEQQVRGELRVQGLRELRGVGKARGDAEGAAGEGEEGDGGQHEEGEGCCDPASLREGLRNTLLFSLLRLSILHLLASGGC